MQIKYCPSCGEKTFSNANTKADDMLSKLENELEELKKKNQELQKEIKKK